MQQSVVMLHIGRSGSRVVGSLLGQHPEIDWQGEALKTPSVEAFRNTLTDPEAYRPIGHLGALAEQRPAPWLGVEVKFYHLRQRGVGLGEFIERVAQLGCERFISLRRKNFLRKVVSSIVAGETRKYHRGSGDRAELHRVTIDPAKVDIDAESKPLLAFLDDYQERFEKLDELLRDSASLSLSYEDDMSADPRAAYRKACKFLGLDAPEPTVTLGRTNPFPLGDIVTNLAEIRAHLSGTQFAWMAE